MEHLYVNFGDRSCINFEISCGKTDRQTAVKPYPTTSVCVDKYNMINKLDCNLHKCMRSTAEYIFIIFEHVLKIQLSSLGLLGMTKLS